jgi:hypothetical protein
MIISEQKGNKTMIKSDLWFFTYDPNNVPEDSPVNDIYMFIEPVDSKTAESVILKRFPGASNIKRAW